MSEFHDRFRRYFYDCNARIVDVDTALCSESSPQLRFHVKVILLYSDPEVWNYFLTLPEYVKGCDIRLMMFTCAKTDNRDIMKKEVMVTFPEDVCFSYGHCYRQALQIPENLPRLIFTFSPKLSFLEYARL